MIHFDPVDEPNAFHNKAEVPGQQWLAEHPNAQRPKDYWSQFKGELAEGFHNLCAYSALYEPVGTVDHFISYNEAPNLAYAWNNYRYASGWINSSKNNIPSNEILDPFAVEDGWFEILLPSLQLQVSDGIPAKIRAKAEFVLKRLHLQHDERVLRQRREWYRCYQDGEISLEGLHKKAPLIARAIERQTFRSSLLPTPAP